MYLFLHSGSKAMVSKAYIFYFFRNLFNFLIELDPCMRYENIYLTLLATRFDKVCSVSAIERSSSCDIRSSRILV